MSNSKVKLRNKINMKNINKQSRMLSLFNLTSKYLNIMHNLIEYLLNRIILTLRLRNELHQYDKYYIDEID